MTDILDQGVATTTAEVMPMVSLNRGPVMGFTVYTDRKARAAGGLTKGRKVGTIVGDNLPNMLRNVARLCEENGGDMTALVSVLDGAVRTQND